MVFWSNKKQKIVSISIIESIYIILGYTIREAIWIRKFINKMKLEVIEYLTFHGNNKIRIFITKNAKSEH